jgi:pimeloyl-ACP methyl ester carboxylesterase
MSDLGVGSGKPALVLLHPFLLSGNVWQDVVPLLSSYHQVFTPTLLGHRGGPPVQRRPATIWDVIDAAEEYLNEHGLQRPHLVGNWAGGFVALELARRGRAATVCDVIARGFLVDRRRLEVAGGQQSAPDRHDVSPGHSC